MQPGRILYIDAYDSFANNIIALLKATLPVTVEVIKINDVRFVLNDEAFFNFLSTFNAVVAGPGPGHPATLDDVGLIGRLWELPDEQLRPTLGICLGFQSLALAFGAQVERLREPRHGMVASITHCGSNVFTGLDELKATQYHSLHMRLCDGESHRMERVGLWRSSETCKDLLPLAWQLGDEENGDVLMGLRHRQKPFWGVQYHPESICSVGGEKLILNWWAEVLRWNAGKQHQSTVVSVHATLQRSRPELPSQLKVDPSSALRDVHWLAFPLAVSFDLVTATEALRGVSGLRPLVLESGTRNGNPLNPETGRFSIIGAHEQDSLQIHYSTGGRNLTVTCGKQTQLSCSSTIAHAFQYLEAFMAEHKALTGPAEVLFWGGLVGFVSYEAGLETIDVPAVGSQSRRPDVWFVYVDRSVVIDHIARKVYIQTLRPDDDDWLLSTKTQLQQLGVKPRKMSFDRAWPSAEARIVREPGKDQYCRKVAECQHHLRAGSSYELCLTDQTLIKSSEDSWRLYQKLRRTNPAPFGAYLQLRDQAVAGISVVGSSPERFLSWDRGGKCQYRPIKGTVKKSAGVTAKSAEVILNSPKECAENLMIVDLIRHDLNGVPGYVNSYLIDVPSSSPHMLKFLPRVRNVHVPKLMVVEEYETVYQLVSVIEGDLEPSRGIAALARSLPPGSMTGAPKKRSCELLQTIESDREARGLYSGVLGYLDVGGGGDFSVVIRTAFQWEDEAHVWQVGAGGAVTALSEAGAEWEEMLAKRERLLDVFT